MRPDDAEQPGPHPLPPDDLANRNLPIVHHAGPWLRLYQLRHHPLYFGSSGLNRFDDPLREFGVLYVGADIHCVFIEIYGRVPGLRITLTYTAVASYHLARVEASVALRLVDLTGPGLAQIGADERLCSGDYRIAQRWSRALWSHPERPDGILYRSRHDPSRLCVAIFDRAEASISSVRLGSLIEARHADLLQELLDAYGFGIV